MANVSTRREGPLLYEMLVVNGPEAGRRYSIGGTQILGRDPSCDLTTEESSVSRRHARLSARHDGLWVEDLGSTNGTVVNGARITGHRAVATGDSICFGELQVRVVTSGQKADELAGSNGGGPAVCSECGGRRVVPCPTTQRCLFCGGSGWKSETRYDMLTKQYRTQSRMCGCHLGQVNCTKCRGTGQRPCACQRAPRRRWGWWR